MATQERLHTIESFEAFIGLPENSGRLFELINGEIIEVSPGRTRNSEIAHLIAFAVRQFCQERNLPCHTSGGDGAYAIKGHIFAPDFAYKTTPTSDDCPDPDAPSFVVEIISPTDKATDIRIKRNIYREAGILLWEIYPQTSSVDVYSPGDSVREVDADGTLDGGAILPGFTLAVKDIL